MRNAVTLLVDESDLSNDAFSELNFVDHQKFDRLDSGNVNLRRWSWPFGNLERSSTSNQKIFKSIKITYKTYKCHPSTF